MNLGALSVKTLLHSPHLPMCRKQGVGVGRFGCSVSHFLRGSAGCTEQGIGNLLQAPADTHNGWHLFPGQDGQVGGRLFYLMTTATEKSKTLPRPSKYSRCPTKDVKMLCKPHINFYGALRSRWRIITCIFTRQGTKTTANPA